MLLGQVLLHGRTCSPWSFPLLDSLRLGLSGSSLSEETQLPRTHRTREMPEIQVCPWLLYRLFPLPPVFLNTFLSTQMPLPAQSFAFTHSSRSVEEALGFPHPEYAFTQTPDGHRALEVSASLFPLWLLLSESTGLDRELIPPAGS